MDSILCTTPSLEDFSLPPSLPWEALVVVFPPPQDVEVPHLSIPPSFPRGLGKAASFPGCAQAQFLLGWHGNMGWEGMPGSLSSAPSCTQHTYIWVCFRRDPRASSLHILWHYGQWRSLQDFTMCFIRKEKEERKNRVPNPCQSGACRPGCSFVSLESPCPPST